MKKLIAVMLMIVMLVPGIALACEKEDTVSAILTVKAEASVAFHDTVYLPVTKDHTIAGIKDADGSARCIPPQNVTGKWIAGWLANGWAKASLADDGRGENVAILTIVVNGEVFGMTAYDNITFTIDAPYVPLALEVIRGLCGEDAVLCGGTIGASMLWFTGDYASVIFFPSYSDAFRVGTATLNGGEDVTPLMAGTFGGQLHFGLKCGWREPEKETHVFVDTNITAEAEANAIAVANAQIQANVCAQAGAGINTTVTAKDNYIDNSGDGCYSHNAILNVNIGFGNAITNCVKWIKEHIGQTTE